MSFRESLTRLVNETPGALGAALIASDGIPLDEFVRPGEHLDLSALAVEFQPVLEQSHKVAGRLYGEADGLREVVLCAGRQQLLFRPVDDEYCLLLVLDDCGVLGKARYLGGHVLRELREAL